MKHAISLDKSTILAALAFIAAACALIILKNGIEKFITGGGAVDPHARLKAIFLVVVGSIFFALSIVTIFETDRIEALLTPRIKNIATQLIQP